MFSIRHSLFVFFVFGITLTAVMALTIVQATSANAATIYFDTFTAIDGTSLASHTPDVTTDSASWAGAQTCFAMNTNQATASTWAMATLPFAPVAGNVYTLSTQLTVTPTDQQAWGAIGFTGNAASSYGNGSSYWDDQHAWMLIRGNGGTMEFANATSGPGHTGASVTAGSKSAYSIVLDTTGTNWVAKWFINNGVTPDWTYTYTDGNPSISYVAIGNVGGVATSFDNLTLSSTPEPGTFVLVTTGILGLLVYAWRKRR